VDQSRSAIAWHADSEAQISGTDLSARVPRVHMESEVLLQRVTMQQSGIPDNF